MKLSEFTLIKTIGSGPIDWEYFAEVTVTTGHWWWKKHVRRTIHKSYASYWHFIDTGEYTPGHQAEALSMADDAQQKLLMIKTGVT